MAAAIPPMAMRLWPQAWPIPLRESTYRQCLFDSLSRGCPCKWHTFRVVPHHRSPLTHFIHRLPGCFEPISVSSDLPSFRFHVVGTCLVGESLLPCDLGSSMDRFGHFEKLVGNRSDSRFEVVDHFVRKAGLGAIGFGFDVEKIYGHCEVTINKTKKMREWRY